MPPDLWENIQRRGQTDMETQMRRTASKLCFSIFATLFLIGGLTACGNTVEGAKKDLKRADQNIQKTLE